MDSNGELNPWRRTQKLNALILEAEIVGTMNDNDRGGQHNLIVNITKSKEFIIFKDFDPLLIILYPLFL